MNLYTVSIEDHTYDSYDSWVVAARTEEEAFSCCSWGTQTLCCSQTLHLCLLVLALITSQVQY